MTTRCRSGLRPDRLHAVTSLPPTEGGSIYQDQMIAVLARPLTAALFMAIAILPDGAVHADQRPRVSIDFDEASFTSTLNARARNDDVAYTLMLGTGGMLSERSLSSMRENLAASGRRNRFVRFFGKRVDARLADFDEVVAGKGDGVVALKRGRLDGVKKLRRGVIP